MVTTPQHEHELESCDGCRSMWLAGYRSTPEQDEAVRLEPESSFVIASVLDALRPDYKHLPEWHGIVRTISAVGSRYRERALATPPPVPAAPPLDVERLREALQLNGYWLGSMLSDVARDYARLSPVQEEAPDG